jgi:hypothetical protein
LAQREDGLSSDRPRVFFDHVQVVVPELERAAADFQRAYGLSATAGGRHPGRGTANMIVPLGDHYLELIAVVDGAEAESVPTSLRVSRSLDEGRTFAAWAVRCDDLDAVRSRLLDAAWELPPVTAGMRRRPDGVELRWRMQELVAEAAFSPLPFVIEWVVGPGDYPGAAEGPNPKGGSRVSAVRLAAREPGADEEGLKFLIGGDVDWSIEPGPPGVWEISLATERGPVTVR